VRPVIQPTIKHGQSNQEEFQFQSEARHDPCGEAPGGPPQRLEQPSFDAFAEIAA
jgi:hypothetical protein